MVVRLIAFRRASRATSPTDQACDLLGERYLRGEITTREYRDRRYAVRRAGTALGPLMFAPSSDDEGRAMRLVCG